MCYGGKIISRTFLRLSTKAVFRLPPVSYKACGLTHRGDFKDHYTCFRRVSGRQRDLEVTEF
jgi:hypothetical protein